MKNTRNFEDVQKAHNQFLLNIMSRTFLIYEEQVNKINPVCHISQTNKLFYDFYLYSLLFKF